MNIKSKIKDRLDKGFGLTVSIQGSELVDAHTGSPIKVVRVPPVYVISSTRNHILCEGDFFVPVLEADKPLLFDSNEEARAYIIFLYLGV